MDITVKDLLPLTPFERRKLLQQIKAENAVHYAKLKAELRETLEKK